MTAPEVDLDALVIRVRADTREALAGVGAIERQFDGPLAAGAARAGDDIGRSLGRAVATGKDGFEGLRRTALAALGDIAANALRSDLGGLFDGGGGSLGGLFGGAGRAIGGGVSPGRPVLVGERGPELFVPASAGRVETGGSGRAPINVTVNVVAPREAGGAAVMSQTAAQVARAVARALEKVR